MLTWAVAVFAIAAVGGLVLARSVLQGQMASWALSVLHALLGATGIVLVLLALLGGAGGTAGTAALIVFVVAALGGFFLASFHLRGALAPKGVVVVHGVAAVVGFLILLRAAGLV